MTSLFIIMRYFSNVKRKAVGGNAKAIDFYAGLELGKGPLNPGMKTWK